MSWNKSNLIFITTDLKLEYEGWTREGFKVLSPYKDVNLLFRIIREVYFRIPFLSQVIWYNKSILKFQPKFLIISDPLITSKYLKWLHRKFPYAQINFCYNNMVGKARHIKPSEIPAYIRIWTYDSHDSKAYSIRLRHIFPYHSCYIKPKKQAKYDVLFVGKDKGRSEFLLALEKDLISLGLRTKFIITADGRFSRKKAFHQKTITYSEITELVSESKAVLNISMENQEGITMRDLESFFNNIKLITTNKNIINTDFYIPGNVFIFGEDDINNVADFIRMDPMPVTKEFYRKHSIENYLDEITRIDIF